MTTEELIELVYRAYDRQGSRTDRMRQWTETCTATKCCRSLRRCRAARSSAGPIRIGHRPSGLTSTWGLRRDQAVVEAMTRIPAKELGPRGITVNAAAPGPAEIPMGRLGQPDDVARVVAFLAGPDGGWAGGQVIKANGGQN